MSKQYQSTPEQLAFAEETRRKRQLKKLHKQQTESQTSAGVVDRGAIAGLASGQIISREWLDLGAGPKEKDVCEVGIKVMTWNLLAQCLVRRELFPTSDCLKAAQRESMLWQEITSHNADVCCLQEADRLEKLSPVLQAAGYEFVYAAGPRKLHGCIIAYRKDKFTLIETRKIVYDQETVREADNDLARRGSSFFTKNIANLVALERVGSEGDGLIVATTHLFWHPRYTYERTRQVGILFREVTKFREDLQKTMWPCILAGDFNFQPDDAAYSLLVGDPLLPEQAAHLAASRVVHNSLDPTVPVISAKIRDDEEGGEGNEEQDPDRVIVNARAARPEDGLLSDDELVKLFRENGSIISAYERGMRSKGEHIRSDLTFGGRVKIPFDRRGAFEPAWTSYTHYWKTVLDYIFILEPPNRKVTVAGVTAPINEKFLKPGLPRKGVSGSDHISLSAELRWEH